MRGTQGDYYIYIYSLEGSWNKIQRGLFFFPPHREAGEEEKNGQIDIWESEMSPSDAVKKICISVHQGIILLGRGSILSRQHSSFLCLWKYRPL